VQEDLAVDGDRPGQGFRRRQWRPPALCGQHRRTYGSFAVDAATGAWIYTLDNANHQNLAQGESHDEVFTVTVTDDFGATTTQTVTVTIHGTNDAAGDRNPDGRRRHRDQFADHPDGDRLDFDH